MKKITARLYAPDKGEYSGTAWLCSGEYALTAAHCVGDRIKRVVTPGTYRLEFGWGWLDAVVKRSDFDLDAALLSITGGDEIPEPVKLTLGRLPALDPWPYGPQALQWRSWGHPRGHDLGLTVYGSIDDPEGYVPDDPTAQKRGTQTAIQLTCEQGGYGYLEGMSGSPVTFEKNVIIGLVRWAPTPFNQKVIYASPLRSIAEVFPEMRDIIHANLRHAIQEVAPNLLPPPEEPAGPDAPAQPDAPRPDVPESERLVGREDDIDAIAGLLKGGKTRLLTLAGAGGMGKTVLARVVGRALEGHYQNGVHFIDLSRIDDPEEVAAEIARKLGVKEPRRGSFKDYLGAYLGDKPTLLILDGFENLEPARPFVEGLLAKSGRLHFIVTCREVLGWRDEHVYEVEPLSSVPRHAGAPPQSAPAVALFVARARRADPDYAYDPATLGEMRALCDAVGGFPLAIEMAAALSVTPGYGPARVLAELKGRGGTLAALIELCYEALAEDAQEFLRRLTVFNAPVTPEAAAAVAATANAAAGRSALEELKHLRNRGLLYEETPEAGAARYGTPRRVHEYCAQRLDKAGEGASARLAHALYYSQLTKLAERRLNLLTSDERRRWLALLEAEHDEIAAAVRWSQADAANVELGLEIVGNMFWFWNMRDYLTEGRRWADSVLAGARPSLKGDSESFGKALYCAGGLAFMHGDYEAARALLEESVGLWKRLPNHRRLGYSLIILGMVALNQDERKVARAHEEAAVALFREVDDKWGLALALNDLGNACVGEADDTDARTNFHKSLAVWRELEDNWGYGLTTSNLGNLYYLKRKSGGDLVTAKQMLVEASGLHRDEDNQWGWAESTKRLGHVTFAEGDFVLAGKLFYDSMALHQKIGRKHLVADCLDGLAQVATALGQPERAARLFGASTKIRRDIVARLSPGEATREESIAAASEAGKRRGMTREEFEQYLREGELWKPATAVAEAANYVAEWSA